MHIQVLSSVEIYGDASLKERAHEMMTRFNPSYHINKPIKPRYIKCEFCTYICRDNELPYHRSIHILTYYTISLESNQAMRFS